VAANDYSRVFEFSDWDSPNNFFKSFVAGIFFVVVMTGLDQDMMQKNLTCKTLRDAQKDMCTYGFAFLPVNALFLVLGIMLTMLYAKEGWSLPEKPDELLSRFVFSPLSRGTAEGLMAVFTLGIIATSFSTVDSALTALTTSFCVDIMGKEDDERLRRNVHIGMTIVLILCTCMFYLVGTTSSLISVIYTLVSYTYGPLLGLFAYAMFAKRSGVLLRGNRSTPFVCVLSPLVCLALDHYVPLLTGYHFGYELLLLNGMLTFCGLWLTRFRNA
jgi:Na+/proline symporter